MKKLLLILTLLCIYSTAPAQFYAGGSICLDTQSLSEDGVSGSTSATTFGIAPELGYNFNRTWAIGLSVPFQYQRNDGRDVSVLQILPFARATFAHAGIVDFFCELAAGYSHQNVDDFGTSGLVVGLRPGLKVNFNDKFSLIGRTTLFSYSYYDGLTGVDFGINNGFSLGCQFTF